MYDDDDTYNGELPLLDQKYLQSYLKSRPVGQQCIRYCTMMEETLDYVLCKTFILNKNKTNTIPIA